MNEALEQIIQRSDTWRGRHNHFMGISANSDSLDRSDLSSGYQTLDKELHQGGWPRNSTIELLSDGCGMGAMGLFMPAMEKLSKKGKWQVFIAPPYTPYAPLLEARGIDTNQILLVHPRTRQDLLWSIEQALRSTTCSAVFSWMGAGEYRYSELRKLQLSAAGSSALAVLFRPNHAAKNHAPASLRLQMKEYRKVHILKQRGGNQHLDITLPPSEDIPGQPQLWELPAYTNNDQCSSAYVGQALQ